MGNICVLIPTYDRPEVLALSLPTWLKSRYVDRAIVVADASNENLLRRYEEILGRAGDKVVYELNLGRSGSVNARNKALKIAREAGCYYAIMADDDYLLPNPEFPARMARWLIANRNVGAVGGRVVLIRKRAVDPDFFLNAPIPIADHLTKALGYIFLDVRNGPRYAEFLTHFFMLRGELLDIVRYNAAYRATAFREESDFQQQVKRLGYKLMIDPEVYVYHIGVEHGGNRSESGAGQRIYWKARNHAVFIKRWYSQPLRIWYALCAVILLILYRPYHSLYILRGLRDGLRG